MWGSPWESFHLVDRIWRWASTWQSSSCRSGRRPTRPLWSSARRPCTRCSPVIGYLDYLDNIRLLFSPLLRQAACIPQWDRNSSGPAPVNISITKVVVTTLNILVSILILITLLALSSSSDYAGTFLRGFSCVNPKGRLFRTTFSQRSRSEKSSCELARFSWIWQVVISLR